MPTASKLPPAAMAGAAAKPGTRRWLPASSTPNGEMPLIAARCVMVVP